MGTAIVSPYPPRGEHHSKMSGVASMSKNIANTVSTDRSVHILANKIKGKSDQYIEDGVTVHRCWDHGPLYSFQIIRTLNHIDGVDTVHVHHEYDGMYGGVLMNAFFPVLLLGLQLSSVKVVTQLHGVLFDADPINTQSVGLIIAKIPDILLEVILLIFNQILITISDTVIIPNRVLKQRILDNCSTDEEKLAVIPHGVEPRVMNVRSLVPNDSPTLLYFGYITWRKGPDILASAAKSLPEDWDIILAGGKVPYLSEDSSYQAYYNNVRDLAYKSKNVTLTGFVDENKIDSYFKQADILILPYRTFVAASGVFSLGLRYSLPFLLSEDVSPLLQNDDTSLLMREHNISQSVLTFSMDDAARDLEQKVRAICMDPEKYETASEFSRDICDHRSWDTLRDKYAEVYE